MSWSRMLRLAMMIGLLGLAGGCTEGDGRPPGRPGDGGGVGPGPVIEGRCDSTTDSDGDGLYDSFEGSEDWDRDGTPNAQDTDSDGDGATDGTESGGVGGCSARNSDDDAIADYLDNDSDNDGLSDRDERETYFTDPLNPDSDGDGFIDVAEVATGHDPRDAADGIPEDDFYVVLPYEGPSQERDLRFGTTVRQADVFFMMDRTGSMRSEVSRLKSSLDTIVEQMTMSIRDIGVGFGGFAGFGGRAAGGCMTIAGIESCSDGPEGDVPFALVGQSCPSGRCAAETNRGLITTNLAEMRSDLAMLEADLGGATWASSNEALYQAATGMGVAPWLPMQRCRAVPDEEGRRYGYPCFRPGSLPIIVVLTDTSSKNGPLTMGVSDGTYAASSFTMGPPPRTYDQTLTALRGIGARVIGVLSGAEVDNPTPQQQFETWARETGTVYADGRPITFNISSEGVGLDTSIVEAIRVLSDETPQNVSASARDGEDIPEQDPAVDATLFVKAITPVRLLEGGAPTVTCPTTDRCDDRIFYGVTPGDVVEFRVRFENDFQRPRASTQLFRATVVVLGNGVAELDEREVVIIVPAGSVLDLI